MSGYVGPRPERVDSAWFGMGASLKEKAWERATDLLGMEQDA